MISKSLDTSLNVLLLVICTVSWSFFMATTKTFLIVTSNKLVDSSNQCLGESIRANVTIVGRIISAFTMAYVYQYFWVFSIVNLLMTSFILFSLFRKKELLTRPLAPIM